MAPATRARRGAAAAAIALAAAVLAGAVAMRSAGLEGIGSTLEQSRELVIQYPILAGCGFWLAAATLVSLALPAMWLIGLAGGALFGPWVGLPLVVSASLAGAVITMMAGRYALSGWVARRFPEIVARFDRASARRRAGFLFAARLAPGVPFPLVNLAAGVTTMRARTFALVSLVGMLPLSTAYVTAGAGLSSLRSPTDALTPGVMTGLLALAAAVGLASLIGSRAKVLLSDSADAEPDP